jgi:uracil-DNA glycosylase
MKLPSELKNFIDNEYENYQCFPPKDLILQALTNLNNTKVVIIGQDPYHGHNQAHGLAFSTLDTTIPPSLKNIFKELNTDLNIPIPTHGNLTHWHNQGVLLLNTILTVRKHQPNSHKNKGWEQFTNNIISELSNNKNNLVFILWGANAHKTEKLIDCTKHLILKSGHPSPLSANQGKWFNNKHFSKTNQYLIENMITPIDWNLNENHQNPRTSLSLNQ